MKVPIACLALAAATLFPAVNATAREGGRPNILLAISDDQSWMHAGAYGDPSTRTPAFDRVAREGVLFNYAYSAPERTNTVPQPVGTKGSRQLTTVVSALRKSPKPSPSTSPKYSVLSPSKSVVR